MGYSSGLSCGPMNLREHLGPIDIYLLDQLLKGRLLPGMSLLDAGCGSGRNLVYFLRHGYEAFGVDESPRAVEQVRLLAAELAPEVSPESFQVSDLAEIPFPADRFDAVLCSAVLHFSRDEGHFDRMLAEMWRVLKPGGLFFARLASTIGVERLMSTPPREVVRAPGRDGALPRGRGNARTKDGPARRDLARAAQDHGRPEPEVDDHLGVAEERRGLEKERAGQTASYRALAPSGHGAPPSIQVLKLATKTSWGTETGARPTPGSHPQRTSLSWAT